LVTPPGGSALFCAHDKLVSWHTNKAVPNNTANFDINFTEWSVAVSLSYARFIIVASRSMLKRACHNASTWLRGRRPQSGRTHVRSALTLPAALYAATLHTTTLYTATLYAAALYATALYAPALHATTLYTALCPALYASLHLGECVGRQR